jgi:hypothetical protein
VDPSGHQIDGSRESDPCAGKPLSIYASFLHGSVDQPRRQVHHLACVVIALERPMIFGEYGVCGVGHQNGQTFMIDVDPDDGADRGIERKQRPWASRLPMARGLDVGIEADHACVLEFRDDA